MNKWKLKELIASLQVIQTDIRYHKQDLEHRNTNDKQIQYIVDQLRKEQ